MIIDLLGFEFEKPQQSTLAIEPLFDKIREFLDANEVDRKKYILGHQIVAGLGELALKTINDYWLVCTTERGANFDLATFSNEFDAVNYFIFRLTGDVVTIDWSTT